MMTCCLPKYITLANTGPRTRVRQRRQMMEQTTNSKVNLFKSIRDPISIHRALHFNPVPHFAANYCGKSNFEQSMHKLIVADQYKLWSRASPSNSSFFNDLINWVQYREEFTGNSLQIVAQHPSMSFHSDMLRVSLPDCSSEADFIVGCIHTYACIWTRRHTQAQCTYTFTHSRVDL